MIRYERKSFEDFEPSCANPTKKRRNSFDAIFSRSKPQCVCCMLSEEGSEKHVQVSGITNEKFRKLALTARSWHIFTRLNAAFDNTASDAWYHKTC